uniref:CCHC-type domain-containing protein n=1 Tax=Tanacetum cinerariifolium TaxID=118510 RepID=A0A6L2LGR2_TANCI|nr:hypothetical protein [Tanacetum cinerariifolium]
MSVKETEQIVAQRVANAIEAINIYESIYQTKQRENKVAGNASNKRKWEGDHNESSSQKQNKEHKCTEKCGNCKQRGYQARDCRILVPKVKSRSVVSGKKAEVICYGCGGLGHYKNNCPIVNFQKHVDKYWKGKAHGHSSATTSNINI